MVHSKLQQPLSPLNEGEGGEIRVLYCSTVQQGEAKGRPTPTNIAACYPRSAWARKKANQRKKWVIV